MNKRLSIAIRLLLGGAAVWAVIRELHDVQLTQLGHQLSGLRPWQYALGAFAMVASFLLLGVVEWMALRSADGEAGARVPLATAMRTGFVANALSQSIGLAVLTGAGVRVRAYARYGLDSVAVAQATAFVTITATLGLLAAGAVAVFGDGAPVDVGHVALAAVPMALVLGGIVVAYLCWSVNGRPDAIGWRRWRIPRPKPLLALGQTTISALDWLLTGAVLYAFMPRHQGLGLGLVLGAYMVAQVVAVTSHVPAGAGVFELLVVAILLRVDPTAPRAALAAALVMFRVVYYVIPLCVALVMAAAREFARRNASVVMAFDRGVATSAALDPAG